MCMAHFWNAHAGALGGEQQRAHTAECALSAAKEAASAAEAARTAAELAATEAQSTGESQVCSTAKGTCLANRALLVDFN